MRRFSHKLTKKTGPLNYYLSNILCASFGVSLQNCDKRVVRVRTCACACVHVPESVISTLSRASKLILGRDEIRPVGRVSSIVRLIDDARSLGPGKRYYENARERPRERRDERSKRTGSFA